MLGVVELIILVVAAVVAVKLYRNPSGSLGKSLLALAGVGFVLVLIAVPLFYLRMRRPEPVARWQSVLHWRG